MQIKFKNKLEYLQTLNEVVIKHANNIEADASTKQGFTIITSKPSYPRCIIRISTESAEDIQARFEQVFGDEIPSYYFYQYPINDKLTYYLWIADRQNNPSKYGINCNEVDLLHYNDKIFVNYYPRFFIQNTKLKTDLPSIIKLDQVACDSLEFLNVGVDDLNQPDRNDYNDYSLSPYGLIAVKYRHESFPETVKEHLLNQDDIRQTLENIE